MALRNSTAYTSVVFGFIMLALTFGCIAAGAVAMSKLTDDVSSIGLWAAYFIIPSVFLLVAGFGKFYTLLAVSIAANVLGILVALAGIIYAAGVWVALNTTCLPPISIQSSSGRQTIIDEDSCRCADFVYRDAAYTFKVSCSDLEVVRDANAAVAILNCLLMIVCFVGSIIGCAGACCVQQVPGKRHSMPMTRGYVIPYGNPDNMMMTRIEERRYVDNGPYPTPGRYGWERGYIQEVPGYDRDPVAGYDRDPVPGYDRNPVPGYDRDPYYSSARARDDYRAPGHYEEPDEKRYYQEKFYNNENRLARVNDVPDRNKGRNPFAGQTNDTFLY